MSTDIEQQIAEFDKKFNALIKEEAQLLEKAVSYFTKRLEKINPIINELKSKKAFFSHPDLDPSVRTTVGVIIGRSQREIYVYDGSSLVKIVRMEKRNHSPALRLFYDNAKSPCQG